MKFLLIASYLLLLGRDIKSDPNHAIYISVVEIDHKKLGQTADIKVKVFTNDLEDALKNEFHEEIKLDSPIKCNTYKNVIENYFAQHLSIEIDGQNSSLFFENCEKNGDSTWLYFKIDCPIKWISVKVFADFLMELFPTQTNVISVFHGENKRFFKLTSGMNSQVMDLDSTH